MEFRARGCREEAKARAASIRCSIGKMFVQVPGPADRFDNQRERGEEEDGEEAGYGQDEYQDISESWRQRCKEATNIAVAKMDWEHISLFDPFRCGFPGARVPGRSKTHDCAVALPDWTDVRPNSRPAWPVDCFEKSDRSSETHTVSVGEGAGEEQMRGPPRCAVTLPDWTCARLNFRPDSFSKAERERGEEDEEEVGYGQGED